MKTTDKTLTKFLSVFLIAAMIFTTIPFQASTVKAAGNGSSIAAAEDIAFNETRTITFTETKAKHFYKFTTPEQGVLTINSLDKNIAEGLYNMDYIVYDESGKAIWGNCKENYTDYNTADFETSVGLKAGTYTLEVKNGDFIYDSVEPLDISISFTPNKYCEIENNDFTATATPMELNQFYDVYYGNNDMELGLGEEDYFSFKAEKNKFYRVTITNFDVIRPTTIIFDAYNSKGEYVDDIYFDTKIDEEGNYISEFVATETDDYRIRIENYSEKQIHFKMKVSKCGYYPELPYDLNSRLSATKGGYDDVHLSWDKSDYATGYKIYSKKAGAKTYNYVGKTSNTYYNVKNLEDGVRYYFRMQPYYSDGTKDYQSNNYVYTNIWTLKKVATPAVYKPYKYVPNYVAVNWKKNNGSNYYEISRSTKKTGTYIISRSADPKDEFKTIRNRGYYYKVRAYDYIYVGDKEYKVYGPWSNVKYFKLR